MFLKNLTRIGCTLCEDYWNYFYHISLSSSYNEKYFRQKLSRKSKYILFLIAFLFFENRSFCEITWKNIVQRARRQMTIWRMRIACWMIKATNTHSEYVTFIAVSLQQWLHESASLLRYTYIDCLVNFGTICRCIISFTTRSLYPQVDATISHEVEG